ncbi:MAG TPA: condensation domain-containing protein, partial [Polyangiaceae bacterium]
MTLAELLSTLREKNIRVWVEGGMLRYSAPKGALTLELKGALAQHKETLLGVFSAPRDTIAAAPRSGPLALSFAQQRLWFLEQLEPGNPTYNIASAARLEGTLDVEALRRTFQEIVRRHEALRTTFASENGAPHQVVHPASTWPLPIVALDALTADEREVELARLASAEARRPFSLEQGPLLRATLVRLGGEDHALLVTMHHIVSDGWSQGVMVDEVRALYPAFCADRPSPLAELPIQYADFAAWQRGRLRGDLLDAQLAYWTQALKGAAPLALPTDRPRPPTATSRGATLPVALPADLAAALRDLSQRQDATLFMTLLAAFMVLLGRYAGQDDVSVGTPIANRTRKETEPLIGFFVNAIVVRASLAGDARFVDVLAKVKEAALGAFAHQEVPFERLVEALESERDPSRNPLFQVMFGLQNAPSGELSLPGLTLRAIDAPNGTAKFDLTLILEDGPAGLLG